MCSAAYSLWHLLAVGLLLVCDDLRLLAALSLCALGALTWNARGAWTQQGMLGWANALTWGRVLATAAMIALPMSPIVQAFLAALIFSLDGADGAIARARGTTSEFGASLDKECDAFFVLALCALLWAQGVAGPWVLVAGLWRYVYGLLVAIGASMQAAPRSNWGRYSYSTASVCLILALVDLEGLGTVLAGFATIVISLSFLRSIYYSLLRN